MSFAAVLDWCDDGERLRASVEHLRRIGVEQIAVLDRRLADHAPVRSGGPGHDGLWVLDVAEALPHEDVDRLRLALGAALAADWVLFAEAGERWLPASGTLHDLAELDEADMLVAPRYLVVIGPDGPARAEQPGVEDHATAYLWSQPFADVTARLDEEPTASWTEGRLPPGRMVRPAVLAGQRGTPGLPGAAVAPARRAIAGDLVIAHAPYGTFEEFALSAGRAFAAMSGAGWTAPDGLGTREDWERQVHTTTSLERLKRRQAVRSAAALLSEPIASFPSEEAYVAAIRASEPWLSLAGRIRRKEGVAGEGSLAHVATFNRPSVVVPPDRIVKFYGPWRDGQAVLEREVRAHALLARDAELPVPRTIAHGRLDDDWRYIVLEWLSGVALSDVRHGLDQAAMTGVAAWLGRFVARLHAIPLSAHEREDGWRAFGEELRWRYANARTGRDADLPPRLLAEAFEWLPPLEAMLASPEQMVLAHADLKDEHVIGTSSGKTFSPAAVIDFGEARLAHPMFELPVVWWSALAGNRELLATFLDHAAIPGVDAPDFPRLALAWAMVHPSWDAVHLGDLAGAADLDELARRLFGGLAVDRR